MERDVKKEKAQRGRERRRHEEALAVESGVFRSEKGPNCRRR
jgi:hypothetical protein